MIRHGRSGSRPVEFKMSVSRDSNFGRFCKQLAEMTGILPANQAIIIRGEEWIMEDCKLITEIWSPEDLVAVSEKDTKCVGKYKT